MKMRMLMSSIICIVIVSAIFGTVKKQTYTNIVTQDDFINQLNVAIIPEEYVIANCEIMSTILDEVDIILKVCPISEMEYAFGVGQQKVQVIEIMKGENLVEEDEIYVYTNRWMLSLFVEPSSAERGFVNIMQMEDEYLIFLNETTVRTSSGDLAYEVFSDLRILPIFNYSDKEQDDIKIETDHTYVSYQIVEGNELFCDTEEGYDIWIELKEVLFETYK